MKLQLWVGSEPASWAAVTLSVPVSVNALPDAGLTSVIVPSAAGLPSQRWLVSSLHVCNTTVSSLRTAAHLPVPGLRR